MAKPKDGSKNDCYVEMKPYRRAGWTAFYQRQPTFTQITLNIFPLKPSASNGTEPEWRFQFLRVLFLLPCSILFFPANLETAGGVRFTHDLLHDLAVHKESRQKQWQPSRNRKSRFGEISQYSSALVRAIEHHSTTGIFSSISFGLG